MPGILYHLSFAEEVYRKLAPVMPLDKVSFMAGNLIPDLATDKKRSHYRKKASVDGFFVPEMELVRRDLFVPKDSVKFGMFCHLYLDYYFIEEFLIPEFIWDVETMRVINPRNNKEWDVKTFFSHSGMYGSYTEINQLLVRDGHVSVSTIEEIPETYLKGLTFHYVENIREVLKIALLQDKVDHAIEFKFEEENKKDKE